MHSSHPPPPWGGPPGYQPGGHQPGTYQPYGPPPPRRPSSSGLIIAIVAIVGILGLSFLGGAAYYGFKRYTERAKEAAKAKEDAEKKLLPTSTYDATADLVDEDFRLRLKWPGKGYKMLKQEDARHVLPDTIAGVLHENGCQLLVIAEYAPGIDLTLAATASQTAIPGIKTRVTPPVPARFLGRPAAKYEVDSQMLGLNFQQEHTLVERDGWSFRLATMKRKDADCTAPRVEDIVVFEEGKLKGRNLSGSSKDHETPQHRLRGGTFESVVHRLRLAAPPGTALFVGSDVAQHDRSAAALVGTMGVSIFVGTTPPPAIPIDAHRRGWAEATAGGVGGAAEDVTIPAAAGSQSPGPLPAWTIPGPAPYETLWAFEVVEGRLVSYRAAYAPSLRPQALAEVAAVRSGVRVLPADEATALARSLPEVDPARAVGPDRALRGGKLVHYGAGFRASLPASATVASLTDARSVDIALSFSRPFSGLETVLVVGDAGDVAAAQRAIASMLIEVPETSLSVTPAPAVGGRARGRVDYLLGGTNAVVDFITVPCGSRVLYVATYGPTAWVDGADAETRAFVESIAIAPGGIPDGLVQDRIIRSDRLGFELELPPGTWTSKPYSLSASQWFAAYEASSAAGNVFVFAVGLEDSEADFTQNVIEQQLVGKFVKGSSVPERKPGKLGPVDGKRITVSPKEDAILANAGGTLFFIAVDGKSASFDPAEVYRGFRVLD